MSIHIGAKKGDIAETILLPGDPLRAKWIAETFFENAFSNRGIVGPCVKKSEDNAETTASMSC